MNEFLKLLLPWWGSINWIADGFISVIVSYAFVSVVWFWVKTSFRCRLIDDLTNEARKHDRPVQPSIKQELKSKFDRNKELTDAWREFEDSLITRNHNENQMVYKTDEASLFFSEERLLDQHLNLRFWNSVPALLVGLGILGTFVGLVWGLIPFSGINFEETSQIQVAIKKLLSGVSTAFVTSVWGMLTSLAFNGLEKWRISRVSQSIANLQRELDRLFTLTTQEEISFRQEDELAQQTQALKSFSTDLANDIKSAMAEGRQQILTELQNAPEAFSNAMVEQLSPSLGKLNSAVEELREQKEESSMDAIGQLIEQFHESLSTSTVTQMEELAKTVGSASQSLMNLPAQMTQMMGEMLNALQGTINIQQESLTESTSSMNVQMKQVASDISNLLKSVANRADEQLGQRAADIETASNQSIGTLQSTIVQLQHSIASIASQTAAESEAMTNRMRELMEFAANRTDEQLSQRMAVIETVSNQSVQTLEDIISKLQQAITSTTSQAATDYAAMANQMHERFEQTVTRLGESVVDVEHSVRRLLQQQSHQTEAVNEQLSGLQEILARGREMLQGMNASVTGIRQLIEATQAFSRQLTGGADRLEQAGQKLTLASDAFNQENEKYLAANRETTGRIQAAVGHLNDSVQRFQTVDNGLRGIFAEIEKGLNTYATTSRESINQYLSDFSDQLAQASRALSGSVEALTDIVEDVTDMNERMARRGGSR